MAGTFKTTMKDTGYKKAMETFKEVGKKPHVKIGVLESAGNEENGLTVVQVATFNEFGGENNNPPERSFIRSTVDQKFNSYVEKSRKLQMKCILQELTVGKALSALGELIQSDIIETINQGVEPENAPSTQKAKGSTTPLIDSGQLKQSIRYQVEGV